MRRWPQFQKRLPFLTRLICAVYASGLLAQQAIAELPHPAPQCGLQEWSNGHAIDWASLRGQVVYVDFWASWCTTCVQSFPFLNALHTDFQDNGLVVLGVNLDEETKAAEQFLVRHPAQFRLAANPTFDCPKAFGVAGMPAAYLIDRQGQIRHVHQGFRPSQADGLRAVINQLLNEAE